MSACCVMKSDSKFYLLAGLDKEVYTVVGYEGIRDGVTQHEQLYNRHHDRGYESSMSACINHCFFQPSIVEIDESILENLVVMPPKVYSVKNVSGGFHGFLMIEEIGKILWEKGTKPRLISKPGTEGQIETGD